MAGGIDWFRWHHGSVTDPKFALVARRACVRLPDVLAVWAFILERASAADVRGYFGDVDAEAVDCLMGMDDGATARILIELDARGLTGAGSIVSWDKRQPKRERDDDTAAERKRQQRARDAAASQAAPRHDESSHVTPCHATSRQKTPRGEESREENSPSLRSGELRASRLPQDWVLPDEWRDWAASERKDLDPIKTAEQFRDYWAAKPGKDGRKTDWQATWRNWVRNQRAQQPVKTAQAFAPPGQSRADRQLETAALLTGARRPQPKPIEAIDVESRILPA